jgi:hypothetical protein
MAMLKQERGKELSRTWLPTWQREKEMNRAIISPPTPLDHLTNQSLAAERRRWGVQHPSHLNFSPVRRVGYLV